MQAPLKERDDIKIFILFLMRNIKYPLEYIDINDIVLQDGYVTAFDFIECFADLLEAGNIEICAPRDDVKKLPELFMITKKGIHISDTLNSSLPAEVRNNGLKNALRLLSFKKRGSDINCRSEIAADGTYILTCSVIEGKDEVFTVRIKTDDKNRLELMKYNFKDRPEKIYRSILSILSGDADYLLG